MVIPTVEREREREKRAIAGRTVPAVASGNSETHMLSDPRVPRSKSKHHTNRTHAQQLLPRGICDLARRGLSLADFS